MKQAGLVLSTLHITYLGKQKHPFLVNKSFLKKQQVPGLESTNHYSKGPKVHEAYALSFTFSIAVNFWLIK